MSERKFQSGRSGRKCRRKCQSVNVRVEMSERKCQSGNVRVEMSERKCQSVNVRVEMSQRKCQSGMSERKCQNAVLDPGHHITSLLRPLRPKRQVRRADDQSNDQINHQLPVLKSCVTVENKVQLNSWNGGQNKNKT
jgi:hypothetical protein